MLERSCILWARSTVQWGSEFFAGTLFVSMGNACVASSVDATSCRYEFIDLDFINVFFNIPVREFYFHNLTFLGYLYDFLQHTL